MRNSPVCSRSASRVTEESAACTVTCAPHTRRTRVLNFAAKGAVWILRVQVDRDGTSARRTTVRKSDRARPHHCQTRLSCDDPSSECKDCRCHPNWLRGQVAQRLCRLALRDESGEPTNTTSDSLMKRYRNQNRDRNRTHSRKALFSAEGNAKKGTYRTSHSVTSWVRARTGP